MLLIPIAVLLCFIPLTGFPHALVHWGASHSWARKGVWRQWDAASFQKAIITAANEVYA